MDINRIRTWHPSDFQRSIQPETLKKSTTQTDQQIQKDLSSSASLPSSSNEIHIVSIPPENPRKTAAQGPAQRLFEGLGKLVNHAVLNPAINVGTKTAQALQQASELLPTISKGAATEVAAVGSLFGVSSALLNGRAFLEKRKKLSQLKRTERTSLKTATVKRQLKRAKENFCTTLGTAGAMALFEGFKLAKVTGAAAPVVGAAGAAGAGGVLAGLTIVLAAVGLKRNFTRDKLLKAELADVEQKIEQAQIGNPLLSACLQLRKQNLESQLTDNAIGKIRNGLQLGAGTLGMALAVKFALVAAGATAGAALTATGIGAAVLGGVGLIIGLSYLAYKNRRAIKHKFTKWTGIGCEKPAKRALESNTNRTSADNTSISAAVTVPNPGEAKKIEKHSKAWITRRIDTGKYGDLYKSSSTAMTQLSSVADGIFAENFTLETATQLINDLQTLTDEQHLESPIDWAAEKRAIGVDPAGELNRYALFDLVVRATSAQIRDESSPIGPERAI